MGARCPFELGQRGGGGGGAADAGVLQGTPQQAARLLFQNSDMKMALHAGF